MRILILVFLLTAFNLQAQINLSFNKRFVECEDKWVAFKMDKDSTNSYGFIYIDEEAGLTFNLEGDFKLKSDNTYQIVKNKETNIKVRLEPNNVKVAIIPSSMYQDLQIDSIPEWLKFYKTDTNSITRLYKWGFMYNGWNECKKALEFLLKAKSIDANYKGLAVELAYSYNCLNDYDKALEALKDALKSDSTNAYINKEYIYTLIKKGDIDKATEHFIKSIKLNNENTFNAENCFNILSYYYEKKDIKNFNIWLKEFKKWPNSNEQITQYVNLMKKELK
jgi:tetratricopeptide (TPR) repeat protein